MPDPILRAPGEVPTALWLTPQGRLANACSDLPCDPCGPPPPPGLWVRGSLCACSSSDETEAWIRAGDLADLRSQGTCPTGRLPDGSCWEVLRGAEEREFDEPGPPEPTRLTPYGVGGCCVCCPGCSKVLVPYGNTDGCPFSGGVVELATCCPDGGLGAQGGYARREGYWLPSESSCPLRTLHEMWWSRSGLASTRVWRRVDYHRTTCAADERVDRDAGLFGPLGCGEANWYGEPLVGALTSGAVFHDPSACPGTPERLRFTLREGPTGGTLGTEEFVQVGSGGGFVRLAATYATTSRGLPGGGSCRGRCVGAVLAPVVPPEPGTGNGSDARGNRILMPGVDFGARGFGTVIDSPPRSGCSDCGDDGGL